MSVTTLSGERLLAMAPLWAKLQDIQKIHWVNGYIKELRFLSEANGNRVAIKLDNGALVLLEHGDVTDHSFAVDSHIKGFLVEYEVYELGRFYSTINFFTSHD